jgi:hypothetical protein
MFADASLAEIAFDGSGKPENQEADVLIELDVLGLGFYATVLAKGGHDPSGLKGASGLAIR